MNREEERKELKRLRALVDKKIDRDITRILNAGYKADPIPLRDNKAIKRQ